MPELLSVARAARLVGVPRGALQQRIKDGELPTFEGRISPQDLLRVYPNARLEDNSALERLTAIKNEAFALRVRERILPDPEVLAARLHALSKDLVAAKTALEHYRRGIERFQDTLAQIEANGGDELRRATATLRQALARDLAAGLLPERPAPLLIEDSFLRVMAASVRIEPSNTEFFVEGSDSILEAALRAGLALNYGCSNGNCGLCKARVVSGDVKKIRHFDFVLGEAEKAQGYTLLCSHTAVSDLVIDAELARGVHDIPLQQIAARVKTVQPLGDKVRLLHLQTPRTNRLRFLAGQSVHLQVNGTELDAPIASCPCDDRNLQFHIVRDSGAFAARVFDGLKAGDVVAVEGPRGEFVLDEHSPRSVVFIAIDTGFAPIKSLIEHAMALNAAETMHLYWLADPARGGHYQANLCRSWTDALDNFRYTPLTGAVAAVITRIADDLDTLDKYDVYLAGPKDARAQAAAALLAQGLPQAQLCVDGGG